jgi:hypothetical protein
LYTFGNAPRNPLRGSKFVATDLSLMKNVPLAKAVQFQIRAEVFKSIQYGQLQQSERRIRHRTVRAHQLRPEHAADAARWETDVLGRSE